MNAFTIIKSRQEDKTAMQKGDLLSENGPIGLNALMGSLSGLPVTQAGFP